MRIDLNQDWPITSKRFVLFIDIMGFKDMVARNKHIDVLQQIGSLIEDIKSIDQSYKKLLEGSQAEKVKSPYKSIIRSTVFSDSILLVSKGETINDATEIIVAARWILIKCFEKGIPIKGAISHGEFTADFIKSLYIGQPLIDAYLLQEELLLYGIAFDGYFEDFILSNTIYCQNKEFLIKYPTPTKNGKINYYLINWCSEMKGDVDKLFKKFYKSAVGRSRLYVDHTNHFFACYFKTIPLLTGSELEDKHEFNRSK